MTPADWSDFTLATPQQAKPAPPSGSASGWDQFALATSPQGQSQKSGADAAALAKSVAPVSQPDAGKPSQAEGGGFWGDLMAPAQNAWQALQADTQRYTQAADPRRQRSALELIPGMGQEQQAQLAQIGDVANLAASPVAGLFNAVGGQGAKLLDMIPGQRYGENLQPLTPAQAHEQNRQIILTSLQGLGPEGSEAGAAKFATAKNASNLASVVTKVPADVALDAAGKLTDEGLEYAARANVRPKDLESAYKAVQEASPQAPAAETAPAAQQGSTQSPEPAQAQGEQSPAQAPVSATPTAPEPPAADGASVRTGPDGLTEYGELPQDVPVTPEGRAAEAQSLGVNLTKGQATRDFSTLEAEERLRASDAAQSDAARQFKTQQQNNIANAVDDLRQAIGDPTLNAEARGQMVQDALRQANENGLEGARAVYDQGRQLADALGEHGAEMMKLDTGDLSKSIRDILIDETADPQARAALRQQAAQYGLIGGDPRIFEDGSAVVKVLDQEGKEGPSIQLPRAPEPLTIQNAEGLRQQANRIYRQYNEPRALEIKDALDTAVGDAIDRAASSNAGEFGKTMQKARGLYRENRETFGAKDVVQDLIDWKVQGTTPKIDPDKAIDRILRGGADSVSALKKIKAVLLSKPTEQSLAAWQAIKSQAVEKIFNSAKVVNADGGVGGFSGAKLNSAIKAFGAEKLKLLLNEQEFNQLQKIRRTAANSTIQPDYISNSSNSGNVLARYVDKYKTTLAGEALHDIPFVGSAFRAGSNYAQMAAEEAANKKTLSGILNYRAPGS